MSTPARVVVTKHAEERARDRLGVAPEQVVADVLDALAEGRRAVRKPRWLVGDGSRPRAYNGRRVFWTACKTRVYLARHQRSQDGTGKVLLVVTCLQGPTGEPTTP